MLAIDIDRGDLRRTLEPGLRNNEYDLFGLWGIVLVDVELPGSASFHLIGIARIFSSEFSSFV